MIQFWNIDLELDWICISAQDFLGTAKLARSPALDSFRNYNISASSDDEALNLTTESTHLLSYFDDEHERFATQTQTSIPGSNVQTADGKSMAIRP
jgi:hypothetical protein